jgi:hypothetical protein
VRIVPNMTNGTSNGFKLYAIRPNSLSAMLGFMTGGHADLDRRSGCGVVRPGGRPPGQATNRGELKVVIERRGQALTFVYKIKSSNGASTHREPRELPAKG